MPSLDQHPTVLHHRAPAADRAPAPTTLDAAWLRLEAGAEDVDFVEIGRAFLAKEGGLLGSLIRRKIRLRRDPRLLLAFGRCFPS
jgi:hypothetical protein